MADLGYVVDLTYDFLSSAFAPIIVILLTGVARLEFWVISTIGKCFQGALLRKTLNYLPECT